jgi:formylglycine-generating enzyme required for sulfatase activity
MGTTEVTNAQYRRFVEATGHREPSLWWDTSDYNRPNQPVLGVSWYDAVAYASWAGMSLPTEAQWEYAARAGTRTRYWSGDSESDLARVGWYTGNSAVEGQPMDVGEKPANPWGLHDVHGNVWEWTADWYGDYPGSSQTDPTGLGSGSYRVYRGGGWADSPLPLAEDWFRAVEGVVPPTLSSAPLARAWARPMNEGRAAARFNYAPDFFGDDLGFRLSRRIP